MDNERSAKNENAQEDVERKVDEVTREEMEDEETKKRKEKERKWEMASVPRMREIVPGLVLGNVRSSWNRELLQKNNISAIVSLSDGPWATWRSHTRKAGILEDCHKWVQCVDSSTQDLLVYMSDICDFIDQKASLALHASSTFPSENEPVQPNTILPKGILIHCDLGISRSPTVIIAYLMRKYSAKLEDVRVFVQTKQKIKPSENLTRQLQVWEETEYQIWENAEKTIPKAPYQAFLDDRATLLKAKGLTGNEPLAPLDLRNMT
jgi:dual specificity phosphatase 12